MPPIPEPLRRALALPAQLLRRYEDLIVEWSGTAWFPRLMKMAFFLVAGSLLLAIGLVLLVGWAASFFVMAIPVAIVVPYLFIMHRRQRREVSYSKELKALETRALAGDPQACFALGQRYRAGHWDAPKDANLSVRWFRKGAEAGHVECMAELAEALSWGHGEVRDVEAACEWFRQAASLGHAPSAERLETLLARLNDPRR